MSTTATSDREQVATADTPEVGDGPATASTNGSSSDGQAGSGAEGGTSSWPSAPPFVQTSAKLVGVAFAIGWIFFAPFSFQGSANLALQYALVAVSLVVLTGWVGQISLAQAAFVGIGAFTTGIVVRNWGIPFPLTLPIAAAIASAAAALLGVVALRVRGLYLAVATLIFAWMVQEYLFNQPWMAGVGGASTAPIEPLGEAGQVPFVDFTDRRTFYFILLAVAAAVLLAAANLRDSKTGRAWLAVKGSEVAAASLGIDVMRSKLAAFAVSGFIAGLAGNLVMTHETVVTAGAFSIDKSLFFLAVAVVGGLTSLGGAVAAGILFAGLEEAFFRVEALADSILIISSALLAGVLLFFPAGLAGVPARLAGFGRAVSSHPGLRRAGKAAWTALKALVPGRRASEALEVAAADGEGASRESAPDPADQEREPAEDAKSRTTPSGWRRALGPLARLLPARRNDVSAVETPDALLTSFERAEAEEVEPEAFERTGLAYEPGTATKIDLPPRDDRRPVLTARDVTVQFGGLKAVNDFTLEVREGEIVGLIGPNGAGKTTLFNAVSGLNQPTAGTVELFGHDVTRLDVHERAQLGMGRTFQAIQLFADRTVFANLMVATHQRNPTGFFSHLAASRSAVAWEMVAADRVRQVMALMGLEELADRTVADLPFGVLRLVELARALITGAPFVMLDEPASGLDNNETDRFMDLLLWARQSLGITMLLIEHDVRVVTSLSDHLYVIDRGTPVASGPPAEVQRDPAVIAAYLGTSDADGEEQADAGGRAAPAPAQKQGSQKSGNAKSGSRAKTAKRRKTPRRAEQKAGSGSTKGKSNARATTRSGRGR